jgi:hypothetical protein
MGRIGLKVAQVTIMMFYALYLFWNTESYAID